MNKNNQESNVNHSLWQFFVLNMITKQAYNIKGRASRKEFFGVYLYTSLFSLGLVFLFLLYYDNHIIGKYDELKELMILQIALSIIDMLFIIPQTAVMIRRFHDINMSAWWSLTIVPLFFLPFIKGQENDNRFGKNIY